MTAAPTRTKERDEEIEALFMANNSYDDIAIRLDVSRNVVAGVCHRRGLRRNAKPIISLAERAEREQDHRDLDLLSDIAQGHDRKEVARFWGVSIHYVNRMLKHVRDAA